MAMAETEVEFATLMEQIQAGSEEAAETLHALYGEHIRRAVRRRLHPKLRPKYDSIDFVQDVWASFFADVPHGHSFAAPQDLVAFLTGMARNKVAQAVRTRLKRQKYNINREAQLQFKKPGTDELNEPMGPEATPSEIIMGREEWQEMLRRQPPVYRRILILLREGKAPVRIAEEVGVSERMVRRVVRRVFPGEES